MPEDNYELKESSESPVPEWLERLQNESWQAELLISGGALVGLFSSYELNETIASYFEYSTNVDSSSINLFKEAFGILVFILIVGFLAHLLLRGFWVGLIGLNAAFPKGINRANLSFKGKFTKLFKEEKNNSMIINLDKICGLLFALTFTVLFSFMGVFLYLQAAVIFVRLFPAEIESQLLVKLRQTVLILGSIAGVITLVDFLSGSRLKKVGWFAVIYYPVHRVISFITFSFLYRRLYYTIVSNTRSIYLVLTILIPIGMISLLMIFFKDNASGLVKSLNGNADFKFSEQTSFLSIKDESVSSNTLDISILHLVRLETSAVEKWKKVNPGKDSIKFLRQLNAADRASVLRQLYQVHIDGVHLNDSANWLISEKHGGSSFVPLRWIRLVKTIDISHLKNGNHQVQIKINLNEDNRVNRYPFNRYGGYQATLNFILHRPKQSEKIQAGD